MTLGSMSSSTDRAVSLHLSRQAIIFSRLANFKNNFSSAKTAAGRGQEGVLESSSTAAPGLSADLGHVEEGAGSRAQLPILARLELLGQCGKQLRAQLISGLAELECDDGHLGWQVRPEARIARVNS
jgi:hypothetical protein